mgnify:CR=1 FL=1
MKVQKSSRQTNGTLYLVATPIGNLQDFSPRACEVLKRVDLIACEDTRNTRKLLTHFQISTPMISYHEHNERKQSQSLIKRLQNGESVALVSDAGMPNISDPGGVMVEEALCNEIPVVPIPGANAALTALVASGMPTQPYLFLGFLPRISSKRKRELEKWRTVTATLLIYESPHRLIDLLTEMLEIWGDRRIAIVRELTKKYEEWIRGSIRECLTYIRTEGTRGEYTLVVEGASEVEQSHWWKTKTLVEHVHHYIQNGWMKKEAISQVAKDRQLPKREVYQAYHQDAINDKSEA